VWLIYDGWMDGRSDGKDGTGEVSVQTFAPLESPKVSIIDASSLVTSQDACGESSGTPAR
jgi:hypothetical protein